MKHIISCLLIIGFTNVIMSQTTCGSHIKRTISNIARTTTSSGQTPINLTGNFEELVITISFPDQSRNPSELYPTITASSTYPPLGTFPNGILLSTYVANNGAIPIDQWYEPAFDNYFNSQSNGLYNVNFTFVKQPNTGKTYTTTHNYTYFLNKNNN